MLTPTAPWIETCSQLLLSRELVRLLGLPEGAVVTPVVAEAAETRLPCSAWSRASMASGLLAVILDVMDSAQLPDDINEIVDYLAMIARGHGGKMQWQEVAKLKSDMMVVRERWTKDRAPADAVKAKCLDARMTAEDTETIVDLLRRAQAGKRLVPQGSYRRSRFRFSPAVE